MTRLGSVIATYSAPLARDCALQSTLDVLPLVPSVRSERERRDAQLRCQGLELLTCPTCGQRATREECIVHRPGQPSVRRIVTRCRGLATGPGSEKARCAPVVTEEVLDLPAPPLFLPSDPPPAPCGPPLPLDQPAPGKEDTMPQRTCQTCGTDISVTNSRKYCDACRKRLKLEKDRAYYQARVLRDASAGEGAPCSCGCGAVVKPGNRFAAPGCVGRFARIQRSAAALAPEDPPPAEVIIPEPASVAPAPPPAIESAAPALEPRLLVVAPPAPARPSLLDTLHALLALDPEELDLVVRFARAERARRTAA